MSDSSDHSARDVEHDPVVAAHVEQLYASHAALVRSVCNSFLRDRMEAEDAVQQTFLSAQRALVNGTSPRAGAAWLATIARNECLARVRARGGEALPIDEWEGDAAPDAHSVAVLRYEADELREALAALPAQQREAILLREVRGLSYEEVASSLSVTTSAVDSLLFRARRNLRGRLRAGLVAFLPGWVQTLRELAVRIGSGCSTAPSGAKVAAVGVGAALFAGGAIAPTVIGVGYAPRAARPASRPAANHVVDAASPAAPERLWRASSGAHPRTGDRHISNVSDTSRVSRELRSPVGSERDGSTGTGAGAKHDDSSDRTPSSNGRSGSTDDSSSSDGGRSDNSELPTTSTESTTTDTTSTDTTPTETTTTYPATTTDG